MRIVGGRIDYIRNHFTVVAGHEIAMLAAVGSIFVALVLVAPPVASAQTRTVEKRHSIEDNRLHNDWAFLERYREANAALPPPARGEKRVVFMGDSITEGWAGLFADEFPGKPYVNRGISGQTTPQMIARFRQDVIALHPAAVVILAGVNDIAGNTGPETLEMIESNLVSMVDLARANGIAVVLCSLLPANRFPWRPDLAPAKKIIRLNAWMKRYAAQHRVTFVDFHAAMADEQEGLPPALSPDGVHPNEAGYRVMAPLVERGINNALQGGRVYAPTMNRQGVFGWRNVMSAETITTNRLK